MILLLFLSESMVGGAGGHHGPFRFHRLPDWNDDDEAIRLLLDGPSPLLNIGAFRNV